MNDTIKEMPLTKKERADQRRYLLTQKILNVVLDYQEQHRGEYDVFKKSLSEGDAYITGLVREKPQEKEFIISAANKAVKILNQSLEEVLGVKK